MYVYPVKVYFNNVLIEIKNLTEYSKLYSTTESAENIIIKTDECEVIFQPSENLDFCAISFVNGLNTKFGGKHVNSWYDAILKTILEKINKKEKGNLTLKDLRNFFWFFISAKVPNPKFDGQCKEKLESPSIKTKELTKKQIDTILKWDIVTKNIKELVNSRQFSALKKIEKVKKRININGLEHANKAGSKDSSQCILSIVEGMAAKTFMVVGLNQEICGVKGRDYIGIFCLMGKILNPRNSSIQSVSKNKEISGLIQALGLKHGTDYTLDENFKKLNYGKILILSDADTDGLHIKGLVLNVFHFLFPSLLKRKDSFVISMLTPLVKVFLPKKNLEFYSEKEFREYVEKQQGKKLNVKYYKGLGTSKDSEIVDCVGKKMIQFTLDKCADENIDKIFNVKKADERKEWLRNYDSETFLDNKISLQKISDFLNIEMIKFSIADCERSIPCLFDGLKTSQRKILFSCFKKNLNYESKSIKVAQLGGFVAENTNYHHGEQNLFETTIKMAQNYVGSNNIPLLFADGQFGSRISNGMDAANARYIFTKLNFLTRIIFRKEDDFILDYIKQRSPTQYLFQNLRTSGSEDVRNVTLVDLTAQPEEVKTVVDATIREQISHKDVGQVGVRFLQFCGKYELNKCSESAETFGSWLNETYKGVLND
jgi:DNA topoisomerase-2